MDASIHGGILLGAKCDCDEMTKLMITKAIAHMATKQRESSRSKNILKVVGHCGPAIDSCLTPSEYFLQLFRSYDCHRNERETILSPTDQLIAVQLVLASKNKKTLGEFDVDVSDVLSTLNGLVSHKLAQSLTASDGTTNDMIALCSLYDTFLRDCNARDWTDVIASVINERQRNEKLCDVVTETDFICINICENDSIENYMIRELCKGHELASVSLSMSLDESFTQTLVPSTAEVTIESCSQEELLSQIGAVGKIHVTASASEVYAEQVLLGYIELLVNSRNEFALARVINVPDRGIDHAAFTDIKHEAKERGMSMFQTITSFIMRIRLGGRSYQPGVDCALLKHTKGLSEFTDLMHKLQTIVEEDLSPVSALRKVCNVVKGTILRGTLGKTQQLRRQSVENTTERIIDEIVRSVARGESSSNGTPTRSASDGGASVGRRTLRIARAMLDHHAAMPLPCSAVDLLTDIFTSQNTPVRLPSMMSQFRSPDEDAISPEVIKPLVQRLDVKNILAKTLSSSRHCTNKVLRPSERSAATTPRNIMSYIQSKTSENSTKKQALENRNMNIVQNHASSSDSTCNEESIQHCSNVQKSVMDNVPHLPADYSSQEKENQPQIRANKRKSLNEMDNCGKRPNISKGSADTKPKLQGKKASKSKQAPPLIKGQSKLGTYFNYSK